MWWMKKKWCHKNRPTKPAHAQHMGLTFMCDHCSKPLKWTFTFKPQKYPQQTPDFLHVLNATNFFQARVTWIFTTKFTLEKNHSIATYSGNLSRWIYCPSRCHFFSTLMADYEHFLHCNTCFNWLPWSTMSPTSKYRVFWGFPPHCIVIGMEWTNFS